MIITQKFIKKVDGFFADKALVIGIDKRVPRLAREPGEDVIILRIKLNLVTVQILEKLLGAEDLGDLDQLVRIARPVEEGFFAEDHRGKHRTEGPHV